MEQRMMQYASSGSELFDTFLLACDLSTLMRSCPNLLTWDLWVSVSVLFSVAPRIYNSTERQQSRTCHNNVLHCKSHNVTYQAHRACTPPNRDTHTNLVHTLLNCDAIVCYGHGVYTYRAFSRDVMLSSNMAASIATAINIHLCILLHYCA